MDIERWIERRCGSSGREIPGWDDNNRPPTGRLTDERDQLDIVHLSPVEISSHSLRLFSDEDSSHLLKLTY